MGRVPGLSNLIKTRLGQITRRKHIPQRTCIACREVKAKRDLIRVVRTPAQAVIVDETGKAQGRGAYLCKRAACWERGLSANLVGRALKTSISEENMAELKSYAENLP